MRKKPNLVPRWERCAGLLENTPETHRGRWLEDFPGHDRLCLELGCGKGRFTAGMAAEEPGALLCAVEKVPDAMVVAMERVRDAGLTNVRFLDRDAVLLPEFFAPGEVSRIYINFPDPWPKKKQFKRRLTAPGFQKLYFDLLPPGGEVWLKTDNVPLFEWSLEQFQNCGWELREPPRARHSGRHDRLRGQVPRAGRQNKPPRGGARGGMDMRLISWNVNGLRAVMKKGFEDVFWGLDADVFCLQETKLQAGQIELDLPGYEQFWCYAEKKGYSGTAVFTRVKPLGVSYNLGHEEHDSEGRVITLEYEDFYLVCVYTPNSQDGLKRLDYRMSWEDAFRDYLVELDRIKPVVVCGDMNVAHEEIDLKNPKTNRMNPGFTDEERGKMTELLDAGFTDTFRHLYPELEGAYTWWSFRAAARERNVGWRIDYFLCSDRLAGRIDKAYICPEIMGSDHCPVGLDLK